MGPQPWLYLGATMRIRWGKTEGGCYSETSIADRKTGVGSMGACSCKDSL